MKSKPLGYSFTLAAFSVFAIQDGLSKHLGHGYPPVQVAMIRYFAFVAFAVWLAMCSPGGLRQAVNSRRPFLQILRGCLLLVQILISILAFTTVGLGPSQAIFAAGPIFVALLSMPILGERVGWRRWSAILVGLMGVMIMLWPSGGSFNLYILLPLVCAVAGAVYGITTRLVSREDGPASSFFYLAIVGFIGTSLIGPFFWVPFQPTDMVLMGCLCCTGIIGHLSLIKAYEHLDAVLVQPLAYWQLVLGALIAVTVFGEVLHWNTLLGAVLVVGAGLFTVWREWVLSRRGKESA